MKKAYAALAVVTVLLAGCAAPEDEPARTPEPSASQPADPEPVESAAPEQDMEEEEEEEPAVACEEVSAELLAKIGAGAQDGTGMVVARGAAYRSPDFEKVWFVAAEFTATGVDPQVGVWATNDLDPSGGIVMSVDGFAKQFTVWPDASTTDAAISGGDPSIDVAKDCLG